MDRLAAALTLSVALCVTSARAAEPRFTFQAAEFLGEDQARAAGETWAQMRLPPGLPLAGAVARAKAAGMVCGSPRAPAGDIRCRSSMVVHKPGGIIGEDTFALTLAPDAAGRLERAQLIYTRDGVPD